MFDLQLGDRYTRAHQTQAYLTLTGQASLENMHVPTNFSCRARSAVARSCTSNSVITCPAATSRSNLDKASTIATPSRTCAARIPSSSGSFLMPFASATGDGFATRLQGRMASYCKRNVR